MKYIVTEKATGEELLNVEVNSKEEGIEALKPLWGTYKTSDVELTIGDVGQLLPVAVAPKQLQKMVGTRKVRADKGQPHGKKQEPGKAVRNRGQFYLIYPAETVITCPSREDLYARLDKLRPEEKAVIIQGHMLTPERQYTLKPVKGRKC